MRLKVIFLILLCLALLGYLLSRVFPQTTRSLLSPLSSFRAPDLTKQLSVHLYDPPTLDYSRSQQLSTISSAISYLVYNPSSGRVYLSKDADTRISPGSFTKLLTTQVALDIASSAAQLVTATPESVDKEPTILELKAGEELSVSDLVRASVATSANDAAATLAQALATYYNQPPSFFIDLMNQKASLLKLTHSRFANPEGYDDDNQYSTLADISRLVSNVQQNYPYILHSGNSDMEDIATTSSHGHYYLPNWNGLLGVYPTVDGLKIAYTEKGGYSTIVTAKREGIPVVVILHHADSIRERDLAAAALLDAAYIQERLSPINVTAHKLNLRYKQWNDLARRIKIELGLIKE